MSNGCGFMMLIGILFVLYFCSRTVEFFESTDDWPEIEYTPEQRDSIAQVKHMKSMGSAAYRVARFYVKQSLNHPSTADFPILSQPLIEHQGDSLFLISHYVNAKNSFGVEGRLYYTAKLQYAGGDIDNQNNWVLWDLKTYE